MNLVPLMELNTLTAASPRLTDAVALVVVAPNRSKVVTEQEVPVFTICAVGSPEPQWAPTEIVAPKQVDAKSSSDPANVLSLIFNGKARLGPNAKLS